MWGSWTAPCLRTMNRKPFVSSSKRAGASRRKAPARFLAVPLAGRARASHPPALPRCARDRPSQLRGEGELGFESAKSPAPRLAGSSRKRSGCSAGSSRKRSGHSAGSSRKRSGCSAGSSRKRSERTERCGPGCARLAPGPRGIGCQGHVIASFTRHWPPAQRRKRLVQSDWRLARTCLGFAAELSGLQASARPARPARRLPGSAPDAP
jgi:hypothetical protein